jgi:hypothetical protein
MNGRRRKYPERKDDLFWKEDDKRMGGRRVLRLKWRLIDEEAYTFPLQAVGHFFWLPT